MSRPVRNFQPKTASSRTIPRMWMLIAGVGALLGLVSLIGLILSFRRKKWPALAGFVVLGLVGAFLSLNATAIVGTGEPEIQVDEFDAPLDDDF